MSLKQLENLIDSKDCVTSEGGILVTQESMTDTDVAKFYANEKADAPGAPNAPDAPDAPDAFKIDTPKINMNRGIGKPCTVVKKMSLRMSLRQQALHDAQPDGEDSDTGKFNAKKRQKKEATKAEAKKSNTILTSIRLSLRKKALYETHNYG